MKYLLNMTLCAVGLMACGPDETISGYADPEAVYVLTTVGDKVFAARATIAFAAEGEVTGTGPCNTFRAAQAVPYPWFELGPIASTRRACDDLALESAYFTALGQMRFAEVVGETLILTDEADQIMVFQAE